MLYFINMIDIERMIAGHGEVLREDGLIYRLADRHNASKNHAPGIWSILIDESTDLAICLTPNIYTGKEAQASARVCNSLSRLATGELERNEYGRYIHFGRREIDGDGGYVPIEDIVEEAEFATLEPSIQELLDLSVANPGFDTEMLRIPERS